MEKRFYFEREVSPDNWIEEEYVVEITNFEPYRSEKTSTGKIYRVEDGLRRVEIRYEDFIRLYALGRGIAESFLPPENNTPKWMIRAEDDLCYELYKEAEEQAALDDEDLP